MRANEFLSEHKKGVLARKYSLKPRGAVNPSTEFAKQKAKVNTPPVSEETALGNAYKQVAPAWAGGTPPKTEPPMKAIPVKSTPPPVPANPILPVPVIEQKSFNPALYKNLLVGAAKKLGITKAADIANLLGQAGHETNQWKTSIENLNYTTPERLYGFFTSLFKGPKDPAIQQYIRNPVALANAGYATKNGNSQPGDGWKYRGRGFLMITGRENYYKAGKAAYPEDPNKYINNPDLLSTDPEESALASAAFFASRVKKGASAAQASKSVSGSSNAGAKMRSKLTQAELKKLQPARRTTRTKNESN